MKITAPFAIMCLLFPTASLFGEEAVPKVIPERPRLFFRAKAWPGGGLSVEKAKAWMAMPEYQAHKGELEGLVGDGLLYLLADDAAAGGRAVAALKKLEVPTKPNDESPSYTGIETTVTAAVYDWLHDHPDFANDRKNAIAHLEWWGDYYKRYLSPGCVPFYCRNSGALTGLTSVGLALQGDSPKAAGYLEHAFKYLREQIGTIRQVEDGATGGACYGLYHQFTDLAHVVNMWRTGTDWDAAKWIKENQGNWLERQLLYQIWATDPNGWFWKDGDVWSGSHSDKNQFRQAVDGVTTAYAEGYGRTWADLMTKRWGKSVYYPTESWKMFLNNNPDVPAKPLDELGRTAIFSPTLHADVFWRDSWKDDATVIRFRAGENVDHHGTYDTGKFTIFKYAPLAIKNGGYLGKYRSSKHMYYKSAWSANVVIFDGPTNHGWQPQMPDLDGYASWATWKAQRDKAVKWPPTGVLVAHEENDRYARALADLSGSTYPTGSSWRRELVFLGYKYLLVLDRVAPGKDVKTRWLLHSIREPKIDAAARLATIDNGKGRLFCKTLLPGDAKMVQVGGGGKAFVHLGRDGKEIIWDYDKGKKPDQQLGAGRLDVVPADESAPCVYLHVLFPTDAGAAAMPDCSAEKKGEDLLVKVGDLSYVFRPPAKAE